MLNKKGKFGIGKFLVMALVLGGGLVYGAQMVQKNQDNRSSAASQIMVCKCSISKYATAYSCSKAKGKWSCNPSNTNPVPTKKLTTTPTKTPIVCKYNSASYSVGQYVCISKIKYQCMKSGSLQNVGNCPNGLSPTPTLKPVSNDCKWSNTVISNGSSKCFNNILKGSKLIKCISGKTIIADNFESKDCNEGCVWENATIPSGESQCFNFFNGDASQMITCTNRKAKVVALYPNRDCITAAAGSCKWGTDGSVILDGQSRCFKATALNYSQLIKCSNGKASVVASYNSGDCTINTNHDCVYNGTNILNGKSQCFEIPVIGGSQIVSCTNGEALVGASYPTKDCSTN